MKSVTKSSSQELNIPQMIQYTDNTITINIRFFVKCNDYTHLISYIMNIMNGFVQKKKVKI